MHTQLIEDPATLDRMVPEWAALVARDPRACAFQHPEWLAPWWRTLGSGRLQVIGAFEGPRLVGLAPFVVAPAAHGGGLRLLGTGNTGVLDVIVDPAYGHALAELLWEYLAWFPDARDGARLSNVPVGSPLLVPPPHLAGRVRLVRGAVTSVLQLPPDVGALAERLPRGLRRTLRRARTALEGKGPIVFEQARGFEAAPLLDHLCRLHEFRWRDRDGMQGVLSDPTLLAFHRCVVRGSREIVRFYALRHAGRVIAIVYALCWNGRVSSYFCGFDPDLASRSTGLLLLQYAIRCAIEEGVRQFDFLHGAEAYADTWGAEDRPLHTVQVLPEADTARADDRLEERLGVA